MMLHFDPEPLRRIAERLSPHHRIAFAAACCERLLPNYMAFAKASRWGQPSLLREALNYVWNGLERFNIDSSEVYRLLRLCDGAIPDTEDFSSEYTSAALDASTAVVETLRLLLDSAPQRIIDIATFCRDTVAMFIQERDQLNYNTDAAFEKKIQRDPLMIEELARQNSLLLELVNQPVLDRFSLKRIREQAQNHGVSNIGVSAYLNSSD